jgi:hypothetical protein
MSELRAAVGVHRDRRLRHGDVDRGIERRRWMRLGFVTCRRWRAAHERERLRLAHLRPRAVDLVARDSAVVAAVDACDLEVHGRTRDRELIDRQLRALIDAVEHRIVALHAEGEMELAGEDAGPVTVERRGRRCDERRRRSSGLRSGRRWCGLTADEGKQEQRHAHVRAL